MAYHTDVERNPEADLAELRAEPLDYSHDHTCRCPMCNGDGDYGPTDEEIAEWRIDTEFRAAYSAMTDDEYNAMLDAWSDEAAARYDAKGGWFA